MTDSKPNLVPAQLVGVTLENTGSPVFQSGAIVTSVKESGSFELCLFAKPTNTQTTGDRPALIETCGPGGVQRMEANVENFSPTFGMGDKNVPLLHLGPLQDPTRVERRRFFRVPVFLTIRFGVVQPIPALESNPDLKHELFNDLKDNLRYVDQEGQTRDLSGGGLGMVTATPLDCGDEIILELQLPEKMLRLAGRVAHSRTMDDDENDLRFVGIHFFTIQKEEENDIVRFLFQQEAKRHGTE